MHFEIYVDPFQRYRWRLVDDFAAEIAISPDGYYNKVACRRYVELVRASAAVLEVRDCTQTADVGRADAF